jgi:hypothetical protein
MMLTRRQEVLSVLMASMGEWIDGTMLATAQVGGSEGLRRLRELAFDMGCEIDRRPHPDPARDCWQYRLVKLGQVGVAPGQLDLWA